MRGNELLEKMELIDPAYVEAADAAPKQKKSTWVKWGATAACFCLIAAAAIAVPRLLPGEESLHIPEPGTTIGATEEPGVPSPVETAPGFEPDEPREG